MDAPLCRDHLQRLVTDENRLLDQLETLLDEELEYLNRDDIEALSNAGQARQSCMGELIRIEDERRSLCRMSGRSGDKQGLEELLNWCDPSGSLKALWQDYAARALRCRERNDRNGIMVTARLKRIEDMLNVITGRTQAPATYGKQGAYAPAAAGRMLRSEA
jgi:flagellar biosynthesis protein FlgN